MASSAEHGNTGRTTVLLVGSGDTLLDHLAASLAGDVGCTVHRAERFDPRTGPAADVVFGAFDHPAKEELLALDERCSAAIPWVSLRTHGHRVHLGPAVTPGVTAGFRDLLGRRRAAARTPEEDTAFWARQSGDPLAEDELNWITKSVSALFEAWLKAESGQSELDNAEVELDSVSRTVERHPVLPLPDRKSTTAPAGDFPEGLVDPRTGVVLEVRDVSADETLVPKALNLAVAEVADMRRLFDWPNDRRAFGSSWDGPAGAHAAAIGEAVERYCGNWPGPHTRIVTTTYDALRAAGEAAVDPGELALYSPRQHATRGFPFAPFRRDSEAAWVLGSSVTHGRPVWVPAFLAFVDWRRHRPDEPRYCYPNLTGVAAGTTLDSATVSGLEEVLERDTSMTWWSHRVELPPVSLPPDVRSRMRTSGNRFEPRVLALPNVFGVPIAAGLVRDRETGWVTIGTAVRPAFVDAAFKAVAEAYSLQTSCRSLDDERTCARIVGANVQSARNLKPWRADRGYLASYREDFHDVVDLMCQLQANLDPRATRHVADRVWTDRPPQAEPAARLADRSLGTLRAKVEAQGFEVIRVDLTTFDMAAAGMHVVRAVVPGLVANFPAAFPMWGRERISRAGAALGWAAAPLDEDELSTFPMPHA